MLQTDPGALHIELCPSMSATRAAPLELLLFTRTKGESSEFLGSVKNCF